MPDVDIDVQDRAKALEGHRFVRASLLEKGELRPHNTGVYFQDVPVDPITGLCAVPSGRKADDLAEELGFFKLDLISSNIYDHVRDPEHMRELLAKPVDWEKFRERKTIETLQQLGKHYELVREYPPTSIDDLACLIALIRPGKAHLKGEPWGVILDDIWIHDEDDSYFYKKSHAVAFATAMVVQFQSLIEAGEL